MGAVSIPGAERKLTATEKLRIFNFKLRNWLPQRKVILEILWKTMKGALIWKQYRYHMPGYHYIAKDGDERYRFSVQCESYYLDTGHYEKKFPFLPIYGENSAKMEWRMRYTGFGAGLALNKENVEVKIGPYRLLERLHRLIKKNIKLV